MFGYAAEEAERLNRKHLGTEHLLLGLLREENCLAADLLHERGLWIDQVREELTTRGADSSYSLGKLVQFNLLTYLESLPNALSVLAIEARLYVRADSLPETPPFLLIEIFFPLTLFETCKSASTST